MVLLPQTQPIPQISPQTPVIRKAVPTVPSPIREVLTYQLGQQRSHQICLAKVGSDLNKYIHILHHQLLQPGHRDIKQEKTKLW